MPTPSASTDHVLEPATPFRLDALVSYAPEAVVSRTLTKGPSGTLTVFAFASGQELSEHTAPFDAYVTSLEGTAELTIGGQRVLLATGETVLMPASVPHAVKALSPFKMLLVMLRQKPT